MLKYIKGDLLKAEEFIIVHQVNCQGVMGAGVAKAIKHKYPNVYDFYKDKVKYATKSLLGDVQFVYVEDKIIVNLFSQEHYYPRNKQHTDYNALKKGFEEIKLSFKQDIAMPKIGCGLGGGDWNTVSKIIEEVFDDRNVYIYEL